MAIDLTREVILLLPTERPNKLIVRGLRGYVDPFIVCTVYDCIFNGIV